MTPHHLTLNGRPYCEHTGCMAGRALAVKVGVNECGYRSGGAAKRAARTLREAGYAAKAVAGACPTVGVL